MKPLSTFTPPSTKGYRYWPSLSLVVSHYQIQTIRVGYCQHSIASRRSILTNADSQHRELISSRRRTSMEKHGHCQTGVDICYGLAKEISWSSVTVGKLWGGNSGPFDSRL